MTGSMTSIFSTEDFISNAACGSQPTTRNSRFSRFFSSVATAGRCWYLMAIAFVCRPRFVIFASSSSMVTTSFPRLRTQTGMCVARTSSASTSNLSI